MITYNSCPCCGQNDIACLFTVKDYTVSHEQFEIWECKNCTLRFTQKVPEAGAIGPYYQSENYISHSDTREGLIHKLYHRVRKRTLTQKKKLIEKMSSTREGSVLDVGCGTGAFLHVMQQAGWKITGLEPDEKARKKAKELYQLELESSGQLFSQPAGSFDAVTLWHVLEHVYTLHDYIDQLKRLLKQDGKLFIAVPNYTCYDENVYKQFWAAYDVPRHLYHFSPIAMEKLLGMHNLKITAVRPMWYDSFYVSMLSEQYKTGRSNIIKAFINGAISNIRAMSNAKKCSSIIYIAGL
jgi:2-polyprenyl-3-methyl-5-hydroxy-6-metoxy-1,4-benzoquinol methylase